MSGPTIVIVGSGSIIGGREVMMLTLARGLRDAGYRVVFFASKWVGNGAFLARLREEKFEYYQMRFGFIAITLRLKPMWWTLDQLRYWPALLATYRRRIREVSPVLTIHTNWHHALLLLPFLDRQRDIYWSHEIASSAYHYGAVFRAIARHVKKIVCVSDAVAAPLLKHGILQKQIVVIHNAVIMQGGTSLPTARVPLRFGIIGQIGEWKGHEDVIDALVLLGDLAKGLVLKIYGRDDTDFAAQLKQKIAQLALEEQVEWCGFVGDPREIFSAIDVCIMPSRFEEPFGLSALEAGLQGRPVICTARGGLPEIVKDGETGIVVESAYRPDLLADAILSFLRNPQLVPEMGRAALERCTLAFSYSKFVQKFTELTESKTA